MLPIQELQPDYYIAIDFEIDEKGHQPTSKSEAHLEKLLELLYDKGFTAQIRPGDVSTLLIFIKLQSFKLIELTEKDLIKNYEFGVTSKDNTFSAKLRIIYEYLVSNGNDQKDHVEGLGLTPGIGRWHFIKTIVPITDAFDDTTLIEDLKINFTQTSLSTNQIKKDYGVKIALYFEFLKNYIFWLGGLSIFGIFTYFRKNGHVYSLTYTFINLIWSTFFLGFWRKKQQYLVNSWGVQNCHSIDQYNEQLNQVNEKFETKSTYFHKDNSSGIRFIKQLAFIPIALVFTAILVSYQLGCFVIEIFLTDIYDGPGKSLLTLLPTVLICGFIPILTIVYNFVADFMINLEDHQNQYRKNNSILLKAFVLNFLTSYMPLIITSFVYLPFAHLIQPHLGDIRNEISSYVGENRFYYKYLTKLKSQKEFQINQKRLDSQFFYFIVTNQVLQLFLKYVLPIIITTGMKFVNTTILKKPQLQTKNDDVNESIWLHNVRLSINLPEYNVDDDFRSIILQYGYLIMFGPVWPLAPLVSIIFNLLIFKLDMFKLLNGKYFKPPIPKRVDSIYPWNWALYILTWLGTIISPIVTAFYRHGTKPPKTMGQFAFDKASVHVSSSVYLIGLVFLTEHIFIIINYVFYKFTNLFKSQIEWENDFIDNDIKLRHDYYSDKVKPNFIIHEDKRWDNFTIEQALKFNQPIAVSPDEVVDMSPKSEKQREKQIETKEKLLKQKEKELADLELKQRRGLEKIKDPQDDIIVSKNDANSEPKLATIDNHPHVSELDKTQPNKGGVVENHGEIAQPFVPNNLAAKHNYSANETPDGPIHKGATTATSGGYSSSSSNLTKNSVNIINDKNDYKKVANNAEEESSRKSKGLKKLFKK
ncbi:unnamed protein product [Candida verbasci]|uniref:Ist2p n=1 Tax=Candida verbasci TaxID=1227364 RepID=A0A9W4TTA6_9ASCO|nr:unnamed protein product [Candida verbasci]